MFLGHAYLDGIGVEPDVDAAANAARTPCQDEGRAGACIVLARVWIAKGIRLSEAVVKLDGYCREPNIYACVALGIAYRDGKVGPKDPKAAAVRFRIACDQGFELGCQGLESLGMKRTGPR
jgi:hypothetical protein